MNLLKKKVNSLYQFIVITKNEVFVKNTLDEVNSAADLKIEQEEMVRVGNTFLTNVSDKDLEFLRDKKRMSNIPWDRLGRKEKAPMVIQYISLVLIIITLIKA
jgi:hypothetical protein